MPTDDQTRPTPEPSLDGLILAEIARQLGVDGNRVVPGASLADDLGVDSLLHMTMVVGLEQRFDIMIPDAVAARFAQVGDVIEAVRSRAAASGRGRTAAGCRGAA